MNKPVSAMPKNDNALYWWLPRFPIVAFQRVVVPAIRVFRGAPLRSYSEVLPGLWVGGQHFLRGVKTMRRQGITAIVNLRTWPNDEDRRRELDHYLWLPTTDHTPPSMEDVQRGIDFIQEQIDAGRQVYVHCRAGVGRAPTMTAFYLVSKGMTPEEAWTTIRKVRPFIYPTPIQLAHVREFYASRQP